MSERLFSKSALSDIEELEKEKRCQLINNFWPLLHLQAEDFIENDYAGFFQYIAKTLRDLHPHEREFAVQDFQGLFDIVTIMQENRTLTREALLAKIKTGYLNTSDNAISRSMELAVRLWLGVNVCSLHLIVGPRNARDSRVDWGDDETLSQMVAAQFQDENHRPASTAVQIDDSFTVVNLRRICRLHIRWTNNLKDHLRLDGRRGQRSLSIYQHKICLINHQSGIQPSMFPKEILDEAIRTLDLLLPLGDLGTEKFLREAGVAVCATAETSTSYGLDDFCYWRNNIAQLLELLHGPPESVPQVLLDTRNLTQWATLWVAIFGVFTLTILFGTLAAVYSVKQYHLALDAYDLSVKSFQLSIALACERRTTPLAGFCD